MKLHVSGITPSTTHYRFLWGFYVRGFKPWRHCQPCFRGTRAEGIHPGMQDGIVELPKATDFFYLHGFAPGPKKFRGAFNLHLAVRPKDGSIATVHSRYGPAFTIYGAEEVVIQDPLVTQPQLGEDWTRCKNFRFAAQIYDAQVLGPTASRQSITAMREGACRKDVSRANSGGETNWSTTR
jgi:hypothetical protein